MTKHISDTIQTRDVPHPVGPCIILRDTEDGSEVMLNRDEVKALCGHLMAWLRRTKGDGD